MKNQGITSKNGCQVRCYFRVVFMHTIIAILMVSAGLPVFAQRADSRLEYVPAASFAEASSPAEIGKAMPSPSRRTLSDRKTKVMNCNFTCDAFVPRQPVLKAHWEDVTDRSGAPVAASEAAASEAKIRLDITGTATGFNEGNYSTIRLSNIPARDTAVLESASARASEANQVLLNFVKEGRIIKRPPTLPVFHSTNAMAEMLPSLPADIRSAVAQDQKTGSLGQARVLGRTKEMWRGKPQQAVTMLGLQAGITYRVRVVEEQANGAQTLVESICRVPVCPADFIDMSE